MSTRSTLGAVLFSAAAVLAQQINEVEPNNTAATAQPVPMGRQVLATMGSTDSDWYAFTTTGGNVVLNVSPWLDLTAARLELWNDAATVMLAFNDNTRGPNPVIAINLGPGSYRARVFADPSGGGQYQFDVGQRPALSFTAAEVEPNDTLATAQPLGLAAQVDGSLTSAADADWYQITLATRTGFLVEVNEGEAPWLSQCRLEFLDSAGAFVTGLPMGAGAIDSDAGSYRISQTRIWPAGTYYLVVRSRMAPPAINPIPTGRYRLGFWALPMNTGSVVAEAPEPNDTPAAATPLQPGQSGSGMLAPSTDSDWWGPIHVTVPSNMFVGTVPGPTGGLPSSSITLYRHTPWLPTGPRNPNPVRTFLGGFDHARGVIPAVRPGTYYVTVSRGSYNSGGSYVLESSVLAAAPFVAASYSEDSGTFANQNCPVYARLEGLGGLPVIGTTFSREAEIPRNSPCFLMQGLGHQFAGGTTPLPYSLAAYGSPNCTIDVDPMVVLLFAGHSSGYITIASPVPGNLALRGLPIFEQVMCVLPSPMRLGVSNWQVQYIGDRAY